MTQATAGAGQWAQVKPGPRAPYQLERGRWYPVEQCTANDAVTLRLPDGSTFGTHAKLFRLRNQAPDGITRISVASQDDDADQEYYGRCPRDHRVAVLLVTQDRAFCGQCSKTYSVEDEEEAA